MRLFRNAGAFWAALPPRGGVLALDLSKTRIGLAGTDPERRLVTPLRTLQRRRAATDLAAVATVIAEREAIALILGWPLNMDGSEGPACQRVRAFAADLWRAARLPILLQDERLTSEAVVQAIDEGRLAPVRPGVALDHYAAAVILEDALGRSSPAPSG